ncbi:MAG: hypothetical protein LKJ25_03230 [Clostridia bacterium]|jgi:hypothetical protein|nr:hypothetical protein [Clostridia bacterium]
MNITVGYMSTSEKNFNAVNAILKMFKEQDFTVREALAALNFTMSRITDTSKVGDEPSLVFDEELRKLCNN